MKLDEWLYTKITSDATISALTTSCFPDFASLGTEPPYIVYINNIGFTRNWNIRQPIVSIKGVAQTKSQVASLNDAIYDLFDTSTAYVKETSSNLSIDSVSIVNNVYGRYDDTNDVWFTVVDVAINHHDIS